MTSAIPQTILDKYSAHPASDIQRSGRMAYVSYEGQTYSVHTFFCDCADVEIALFATGRESAGNLQAVYVCLNHGTHTDSAQLCGNPAARGLEISREAAGRIFGYSEQMARLRAKKSKIPQWGFTVASQNNTDEA